jgi:radical SAM protein with 4Fe4S-binding SPASM domain
MKDYFIQKKEQLQFFDHAPLAMASELLLLEFSAAIEESEIRKVIEQVSASTSKLAVKATPEQLAQIDFSSMGIKTIVLKLALEKRRDQTIAKNLYRDTPHREKTESMQRLLAVQEKYTGVYQLAVELELVAEDLELLFAFVAGLEADQLLWLSLDPAGLDYSASQQIKEQFSSLKIYAEAVPRLFFRHNHRHRDQWMAKTENPFQGPRHLDLDISNVCTHDCHFCGLYAPGVTDGLKDKNGEFSPELKSIYSARIEPQLAHRLLEKLPDTIELLTFGGAGDPFTHPQIMSFITSARERSFSLSTFTNYAYMSDKILEQLHQLCGGDIFDIHITVNISGANPESYVRTRPNQRPETFHRVVEHLKVSSELLRRDKRGVIFNLMCVTSKLNFAGLPEFVGLAADTGAYDLWIKPMEVHGKDSLQYLIGEEDACQYARMVRLVLHFSDSIGVELKDREMLELIVHDYQGLLDQYDSSVSFAAQIKEELAKYPLLMDYYLKTKKYQNPRDHFEYPPHFETEVYDNRQKNVDLEDLKDGRQLESSSDMGAFNSGYAAKVYDQIGCSIGHEYLRIEVDGKVSPCCISNYPIANLNQHSIEEIWRGVALQSFRQKLSQLPTNQLHRRSPEWTFCQQCPHIRINKRFDRNRRD